MDNSAGQFVRGTPASISSNAFSAAGHTLDGMRDQQARGAESQLAVTTYRSGTYRSGTYRSRKECSERGGSERVGSAGDVAETGRFGETDG
jgi:hypothetical protein